MPSYALPLYGMLLYGMPLYGLLLYIWNATTALAVTNASQASSTAEARPTAFNVVFWHCWQVGGGCNGHLPGRRSHDGAALIHFWGPRHQQAGPCLGHHAGRSALHVLLHVLLHIVMVHNIAAMQQIHCSFIVHSTRFVAFLLRAFATYVAVVLLVSNQIRHWPVSSLERVHLPLP
jgi:hypothetical protein